MSHFAPLESCMALSEVWTISSVQQCSSRENEEVVGNSSTAVIGRYVVSVTVNQFSQYLPL